MKKQYLIPLILILVLGSYLLLKKDDQRHYDLPTLPALEQSDIDKITIQGPQGHLELKREKSGWAIAMGESEDEFEADAKAVDKMLDTLTQLRITALASEKQDQRRYELDADQAFEITAFGGETQKRRLRIGKPSPTGNHTFVMVGKDTHIYHAAKNFRSNFDGGLDDFRNKQVLSFQRGGLKNFTVEIWGKRQTFTAVAPGKAQKDSALAFEAADGSKTDAKVVTDLLSTLSDLTCDAFPRDMDRAELEKSAPICKITLENEETMVLNLFGEKGLATSSMVPFPFQLQSYAAKDIQSYAEKLTGTEQIKETDKAE